MSPVRHLGASNSTVRHELSQLTVQHSVAAKWAQSRAHARQQVGNVGRPQALQPAHHEGIAHA